MTHAHSLIIQCSPSIEHVTIPKEISTIVRKNVIGRVDYSPSGKSFVTLESEDNPSEQVQLV